MGFAQQALFLLLLFLKLKSWRFLFGVVTIVCIVSNNIFYDLFNSYSGTYWDGTKLKSYGVKDFVRGSRVVASQQAPQTKELTKIVSKMLGGVDDKSWLMECTTSADCKDKYFYALHSTLDSKNQMKVTYENETARVHCQDQTDSNLACSFIIHLVTQSLGAKTSPNNVFKEVKFFTILYQNKVSLVKNNMVNGMISGTVYSKCRSKNSITFVLPTVISLQLGLAYNALVLYITVGTLYAISKLKKDGFLQLMHQNGLPVGAYWCVLWLVTILEMVIFGIFMVLAYFFQCPGYFSSDSLFLAFFLTFLLGLSISAFGYLLASILSSYFLVFLSMLMFSTISNMLMLLIRFIHSAHLSSTIFPGGTGTTDSLFQILLYGLLWYPFAHIAEFFILILPIQHTLWGYPLLVFLLFFVFTVLLILLSLHVDFVSSNGNGYRLPVTFLCRGQFWRPDIPGVEPMQTDIELESRPNIEPVEAMLQPRIVVRDVSKTYRPACYSCNRKKVSTALSGVSCTFYDDQITALIGHNGAGKTTLLKILIGEENPTSGSAVIDAHKVTDPLQRQALRGQLGICHQKNVLCSALTVLQCIELVLMSRGYSLLERLDEVIDLFSRLDLDDKGSVKVTDLSGGQKRKLCTILALIGNPKVIFLDEPTSGLDPVSRRRLWQILQEYKVGRAIVLCTQFMDEADILADRKIFLSSGSLICAGSSLFLKHAFGCGFVLNVSLKSEQSGTELMKVLKTACPSIRLQNQFRTEMELMLPASESQELFKLVRKLETQTNLVEAFGLSYASLDEIFMKLKGVNLQEIETEFQSGQLSNFTDHQATANLEVQSELQTLLQSHGTGVTSANAPGQFGALMKMNFIRLKRSKLNLICRIFFPVPFLLMLVALLFFEGFFSASISKMPQKISPDAKFSHRFIVKNLKDSTDVNFTKLVEGSNENSMKKMIKNGTTELTDFLSRPDVLSEFKKNCMSECPIFFSSSWSQSVKNTNRSVHIGIYERKNRYEVAGIGQLSEVKAYSLLTTHFRTNSPFNETFAFATKGYTFWNFIMFALLPYIWLLTILPITFINDPLEDKGSNVRYYLFSMGLRSFSYWFITFLTHWCQYAIPVVLSAIIFASIASSRFLNTYFLVGLFVPCLLLGCASNLLTVYAISSVIKKTNSVIIVEYIFVVSVFCNLLFFIQKNSVISIVVIWMVPPTTPACLFFYGIKVMDFAVEYYNVNSVADVPNKTAIFFSHPYTLFSFLAMIVHIILLSGFIAVMENRSQLAYTFRQALKGENIRHDVPNKSTDTGVKQEVERVSSSIRNEENVLEVRDLEKRYGNGVKAVRGVTFGSMTGEVFGLVGPNGAGKTTTLSIVVGKEMATSGSCEVCFDRNWMSCSSGDTNGAVGYCPQHNPLFKKVTVLEHMNFYSQLRGVPSSLAAQQIPKLLSGLGLEEHKKKQANQLSGGIKRCLCLAISLLGNPSLVVIDEATTGVDPGTKRLIWSAIRGMANDRRSVVVTTHSMEEGEALCSRVGIINNGHMIAFGTIQQLKDRYGDAYTLDIILHARSQEEISELAETKQTLITAIQTKFSSSTIVENLFNRIQFMIPLESFGTVSEALSWISTRKEKLKIQFFAFYEMSMDEMFVNLMKEHEAREESVKA